MITEAIKKLVENEDLSYDVAMKCMDEIMKDEASQMEMAAYLTALRMKGETIEEISASAQGMRNHATKLEHEGSVLEIVGTGGDCANSFNISTTSAMVIAAADIPVAKHGNRSVSSKCGAADVLESLGVNINISPEKCKEVLEKTNICFMFAQIYHKAMKYVAPVRKDLGIRTIFNILGPLSNPANADMQLMGVYAEELVEPMAKVLINLGVQNGMVVFGKDGLDEISASSDTVVCEIRDGKTISYIISPEQFGFEKCDKKDLVGGDPEENAAITRAILEGERGPKRNAVIMNAAAGIHIAKPELSLEDAAQVAAELIDSGKALTILNQFITISKAA